MTRILMTAGALLLVLGLVQSVAYAIPDCPLTFSSCVDVPGKECRLRTDGSCTITDTHDHHCKLPDGNTFSCPGGQSILVTNCECFTRLQNICCPNCPEFTCGDCETQPGSQSYTCG